MNASHAVITILLEADATYSWLLPDGKILPVTPGRTHEDVAMSYYYDKFDRGLPDPDYVPWALDQGWQRMVGNGFETTKLTAKTLRRVQNAYIDAGVRDMELPFFVDIRQAGKRDWQSFEVPYREFLDMGKPGELRRFRVESLTEQERQQVARLRHAWDMGHDEVQQVLLAAPEQIEDDEDLYAQHQTLLRDLFPEYVATIGWGAEHDPLQDLVYDAYHFGEEEQYKALADFLAQHPDILTAHHYRVADEYTDEYGMSTQQGRAIRSIPGGKSSRELMELGLRVLQKLEADDEPDEEDFEAGADPFETARDRFGVTTNMDSAFYLLPDGDMLSGGGGTSSRAFDHRQIGYGKGGTAGMQEFMSLGAIRLMPESGGLDIMVRPTPAQMGVIEDWIYHYNKQLDLVSLDLQAGIGDYDERQEFYLNPKRTFSEIYSSDEDPEMILDVIRRFFGG